MLTSHNNNDSCLEISNAVLFFVEETAEKFLYEWFHFCTDYFVFLLKHQ